MTTMRTFKVLLLAALVPHALPSLAVAQVESSLDCGFRLMYNLDFKSAGRVFQEWQLDHPRDPLGPMAEASVLLFEEFDRLGILEAQFYVDDTSIASRRPMTPDPDVGARFEAARTRALTLAEQSLAGRPDDRDALFALATAYGLRADYAALIEGRDMEFLSNARKAVRISQRLLELAPDYADAHLAGGITQYVVGSLVAPLRWLLRLAGYSGDRTRGMAEVRVTAERGRLLGPFARILLAIAYLRSHDTVNARRILVGLAADFPSNTLFTREIQRLDGADR